MPKNLNHCYRLIWSAARQMWIAVSDLGKNKAKTAGAMPIVAVFIAFFTQMAFATDVGNGVISDGEIVEPPNNPAQWITTGGIATYTVVNNGGIQTINTGGLAISTTVNNGGQQQVFGGKAQVTVVNNGGVQFITSGLLNETTINVGGLQAVLGGTVTKSIVNGGLQNIRTSGSASETTINDGGTQNIEFGGVANTTIINVGAQNVAGTANNTTINSGGTQTINSGGIANQTIILTGGTQNISGGTAAAAQINSGGTQTIGNLGVAKDSTINGGIQTVNFGGVANATTINAGTQNVAGTANNTLVQTSGLQVVISGGQANNTTLNLGAQQQVLTGGNANATSINSGGILTVNTAASASNVTQMAGGALITNTDASVSGSNTQGNFFVDSASHSASKVVLENGGKLTVNTGATASDTQVNNGGELILAEGIFIKGTTRINGTAILTANNISNSGNLLINRSQDTSYSFGMSGSGSLSKIGASTLSLSGALSYTGDTIISDGTLALTGASTLIHSPNIQIAAPATLDVSHTSNGQVQLQSLASYGQVNLANGINAGRMLTINGNLTGASTFRLNYTVNGANAVSDQLALAGSVSGVHEVNLQPIAGQVSNLGSSNGFRVINGQAAPALAIDTFSLSAKSKGYRATSNGEEMLAAGAYTFYLQQQGKDWYIAPLADTQGQKVLRPELGAYEANQLSAMGLTLGTLLTHNSRESTRYCDATDASLATCDHAAWARIKGVYQSGDSATGKMNYSGYQGVIQAGQDIFQQRTADSGTFKLGVMGSYGFSNIDSESKQYALNIARGEAKNYRLGAYGTWYQDQPSGLGWYVDSWLQYGYNDNSVLGDSYTSHALTGSLEFGYTTALSGVSDGLLLTPNVQLVYSHLLNGSYMDSADTDIQWGGDAGLARLGFGLTQAEMGNAFHPFAQVNYLRVSTNAPLQMDDYRVPNSGSHNVGELVLGFNQQLHKDLGLLFQINGQWGDNQYRSYGGQLTIRQQW